MSRETTNALIAAIEAFMRERDAERIMVNCFIKDGHLNWEITDALGNQYSWEIHKIEDWRV